MELHEWGDRWRSGQIGFHQSKVTSALEEYGEEVFHPASGRVLVPLCGKTLDMIHLADQFDTVVGIEYVEQAVREFFDENEIPAEVTAGPPITYAADSFLLFADDFFAVTTEHTGHIDAVFDRASLVALDGPTRRRYAQHLTSLLPAGARILLVTFHYDQSEMSGPPFAVSDEEVTSLFEADYDIEHLRTRGRARGAHARARPHIDDGVDVRADEALTKLQVGDLAC